MRAADIHECVEIVAAHPVVGPRYQDTLEDLHVAWHRLLDCDAKNQFVFEEVEEDRTRILAAGVSVFVTDDFVRWLKTPPLSWFGPELARRIARGQSPLLSDKELREANSRGGLNLLCWENSVGPDEVIDLYYNIMPIFMAEHRGYLWKEIIAMQADTADRFRAFVKSGGRLMNPANGQWEESFSGEPEEIVNRPHLIGLSREIEMRKPGSLVGMLFNYQAPHFGFSVSEQRLLLAALRGGTDEELADRLGISLSAVKKAWRAIYDRVAAEMPDIIPARSAAGSHAPERTREKKRHLMAYLQEHPEELRPHSRKLVKQNGGAKAAPNTHKRPQNPSEPEPAIDSATANE
jgi:DNA-binding CsgD family transcriptional regulator